MAVLIRQIELLLALIGEGEILKLTLVIYSASIIGMTNGQEQQSKIRLLLA